MRWNENDRMGRCTAGTDEYGCSNMLLRVYLYVPLDSSYVERALAVYSSVLRYYYCHVVHTALSVNCAW